MGKQEAHSPMVGALAPVFEKSATDSKPKPKLLKCKKIVNIAAFNIRTLNTVNQLPELAASADKHNIDIICRQEHRFYYCKLGMKYHDTSNGWRSVLVSALKNSVNAIIVGVGMLLSPHTLKSLNNVEKIHHE